jgi:coenzyme F420-reducing hydrogenase alpha subunit
MNSGFSLEGGIDIELTVDQDRIVDVSITNRRPLALAARLEGLSVENALRRVGALYSVCRIAQGLASCTAVEDACGIDPSPSQKAARDLLLRGETALEHTTTALLHWPSLLGERRAAITLLKHIRLNLSELSRSIYPDGDWARPGGGRLTPDKTALAARLAAAQDAIGEAGLAVPLDLPGWKNWLSAAQGPAASLMRLLDREALAGYGSSEVPPLERIDGAELEWLLAAGDRGAFIAEPVWEGSARETGPLARRLAEPVIREAIALHGRGLAARFLAQCIETVRCLEEMQQLTSHLCNDNGQQPKVICGTGLGLVEAARGLLAHRVHIVDGSIQSYRILAPTEWNFHPNGALCRGLKNGCDPHPARLAQFMVVALDPCVPWRIQIH